MVGVEQIITNAHACMLGTMSLQVYLNIAQLA